MAELPGDPRPEKETEVIAVDLWVLPVCPLVLKLDRQFHPPAFIPHPSSLIPHPSSLIPHPYLRSIPLLGAIKP